MLCRLFRVNAPFVFLAPVAVLLSGCGFKTSAPSTGGPTNVSFGITGKAFGGQQPIVGASIQLYATSTSGYSAASTPLLTVPVLSLAGGAFNITGDYTCPSADTQVYMTATGGNPGLSVGVVNPQIALMAALGSCGNLSATTNVLINEATTVAAVWALAPFMADYSHVGTSSTNITGLKNAFVSAAEIANVSNGQVPGPLPDSNVIAPVMRTNTIADILSACINSAGGASGDGSPCGKLMLYATPTGATAPTNTVAAALNIASEPGRNAVNLYTLVTAGAPFQPTVGSSAPNDYSLGISIVGGNGRFLLPFDIAIDANGNVWLPSYFTSTSTAKGTTTLSGQGFVSEFSNSGSLLTPSGGYSDSTIANPVSLAIDASSNLWIENAIGIKRTDGNLFSGLVELSPSGTVLSGPYGFYNYSTFTDGAVTIDGAGDIWAKGTFGTVEYKPAFGFLSPAPTGTYPYFGQVDGYCNAASCNYYPAGPAIDTAGNVWLSSSSGYKPVQLSASGSYNSPSGGYTGGGFGGFSGNVTARNIAIDANNNAWMAGVDGLSVFSQSGTPLSATPYNANVYQAIATAVDGNNSIWVLNGVLNGGLTHYSVSGIQLSSSAYGYGYAIPYSQQPANETGFQVLSNAIAIDSSGSIWTSSESNLISKVIGIAAPVVTPASVALTNKQLGGRP